jgi:creatinine amidohydrolase/Fe(II)-dependent formamide hydrolase-like protein
MAHADEFETSLYLHLAPERVRMDLAVKDDDRMGKFVSSDSTLPGVAAMALTLVVTGVLALRVRTAAMSNASFQ